MTNGPIMLLALEGPRAIEVCRKLLGATFGYDAEPGTIRGDLGLSSQYNLVHGSDSREAAERELSLFFSADELCGYPMIDDSWME
jgi:nucleoside-diphosphate kinase